MKVIIQRSEGLISFNENMIKNFQEHLNINFPFKIIPQSVNFNQNNLTKSNKTQNSQLDLLDKTIQEKEELDLIFSHLNIEKGKKIILFPAGMRKIKDPLFITNQLIKFLEKNKEFICLLIGSIYDQKLFEEISSLTKNTNNFLIATSLEHKDFIVLLKNSSICLNSSINEGMSNVILEALSLGIPVLARKNEGNSKLIKNDFNGFLFEHPEEFLEKMEKMLEQDFDKNEDAKEKTKGNSLVRKFIENGKNLIKEKFSYEAERDCYKEFLVEVNRKYFFDYEMFNFFFSKNTHPFSFENNEIFDVREIIYFLLLNFFIFQSAFYDFNKKLNSEEFLNKENKDINILDVGCGAGIFSFCFLYKNLFEKKISESEDFNKENSLIDININLYLSDIDEECVYSTFININNYKKIFKEKILKFGENFYKFNLSFIDIAKGDLAKNVAFNEKYKDFFDIILANLPQTPSEEAIRSN